MSTEERTRARTVYADTDHGRLAARLTQDGEALIWPAGDAGKAWTIALDKLEEDKLTARTLRESYTYPNGWESWPA